jgi:type IX secretion system PorP/SprF family membrane protein
MPKKIITTVACFIFCITLGFTQEPHYSSYHFTPLNVNPAFAGAFSGSYRVNGIYSTKHFTISPKPFVTYSLSADAPIVRGIRKQDWVGIGIEMDVISSGLNFTQDSNDKTQTNSVDPFQNWSFAKIGVAYHLALDKKQSNIFTIGAQFMNGSRNFNQLSQFDGRVRLQTIFPDLDIVHFNSSKGGNNRIEYGSYKDLSVGVLYNARRKTSDLKFGLALEGLLNPKIGFNSKSGSRDSTETKYFGINLHGVYEMQMNKKTQIIPALYYYSLGPANALILNTNVWYKLDDEKDFRAGAGLGLRNLRAAIVYLGAEFKDLRVGLSYDLDISSASIGSGSVGGVEVGVSYLGKIYKKPKPKPVIFCPRL